MKLLTCASALLLAVSHLASSTSTRKSSLTPLSVRDDANILQDIVTWDSQSLKIHGEKLMIYSAEFHPFRLPVPSLWLDVLQKVRALGFNAVSIYIDWALLEGKPGEFISEGALSVKSFFDSALEAGIWVIARPGPYINAEVSGGGFPGWLQRLNATLRDNNDAYINATSNYANHVNKLIADAQITNGGPVILFQPENEYFFTNDQSHPDPPDHDYIARVVRQARDAGIVVPLHSNDGDEADFSRVIVPGPDEADILGYDAYPLGFDCFERNGWRQLPWKIQPWHDKHNPSAPLSTPEFQGGAFTNWAGAGPWECAEKFNQEFERVYYKDLYSSGFGIISLYMTYGGTNWGNLGMPHGPTTYDYGAAIGEDRAVNREKYSELKLQAQLFKVAPGYLTTGRDTTGQKYTTDPGVVVTARLNSNATKGHFFVVRQQNLNSYSTVEYSLNLPTSQGNISIPQLGGKLSLHGRDSKVHVTDFDVGGTNVLYSTAEIFTWKQFDDHKVLIVYGGPNEQHELALSGNASDVSFLQGSELHVEDKDGFAVLQYNTTTERQIAALGDLQIYFLDRNSAYNYWVTDVPGSGEKLPKNYGTAVINPKSLIINGPYLSRTAEIRDGSVHIHADFNSSTSSLEVIGAPKSTKELVLNGKGQAFDVSDVGTLVVEKVPNVPTTKHSLPDLKKLDWHGVDTVPEISPDYDSSKWQAADLEKTYNSWDKVTQKTPTSLFSSDYGFHTGALIFIGKFKAAGGEEKLTLSLQGGIAFAYTVWLDGDYLGSYAGSPQSRYHDGTYEFDTPLTSGTSHTITVLIDNMGLESNWVARVDTMKEPRGILDWGLETVNGTSDTEITWALTGNLGGEDYQDKARGPLNEGGFYAERNGYHLPNPPLDKFKKASPFDGLKAPGATFYTAKFSLDLPAEQDVPLYVVFHDAENVPSYRAFIFINGWQFGRYVSNMGPQTYFPVPEGIINHRGENWIGLVVWAIDTPVTPNLKLEGALPVLTGMKPVELVDSPAYEEREGAY